MLGIKSQSPVDVIGFIGTGDKLATAKKEGKEGGKLPESNKGRYRHKYMATHKPDYQCGKAHHIGCTIQKVRILFISKNNLHDRDALTSQ